VVSETAIIICLFGLAPFVVMFLVGVWQVDAGRLTQLPPGGLSGVHWTEFINMLFWNLNYLDSASSFSGDVRNPGRAYPRAMAIAVTIVMLSTGQ
jgi:amino acid transporter